MVRPNGVCRNCETNTTIGIWRRYPPLSFHGEDDLDEDEIPEYCPTIKRYDPEEKREYDDIDDFIVGNYCPRCRSLFPWRIQPNGRQEWSENETKYLEKMKRAGSRFPNQ